MTRGSDAPTRAPHRESTRRLTVKGQHTRQRIVEAAATLFFEGGVQATTVEDVQRAGRVSASQLYHYFDNKSALVRAVIEQREDQVVGSQEHALAAVDSVDGLRLWADAVVDTQARAQCRGGCPIGSLSNELAEVDGDARFALSASFDRWADALRDGLRRMQAKGHLLATADTERLAWGLLAALQGGITLGQAQRSVRPLRLALDTMIDHIAGQVADRGALAHR